MGYEKQNFQSGQVLTAAQLNHIEEGIDKILPAIEDGDFKKVLALNENGVLTWKDEDYGWTMEDQLLFYETDVKAGNDYTWMLAKIKPEVGDVVTAYLDDKVFTGKVELSSDGKRVTARVTNKNNNNEYLYFFEIEPGVSFTLTKNPSSLTGHLKVMVRTKKYNKLDYKYLPIPSVEGEAYHSINLNNSHKSRATGEYTIAANHGKALNTGDFAINTGTASGGWSFAQGLDTETKGYASHAEGCSTIASGTYQHTEGSYNIEDTQGKYAHIVGNGTSIWDNDLYESVVTRSNAYTLDWDGNGWYQGDVYIGGNNQDEGKKLATEEYVDTKIALPSDNGVTNHGTAGQFAVSDGKGGITWKTLIEAEEVAY